MQIAVKMVTGMKHPFAKSYFKNIAYNSINVKREQRESFFSEKYFYVSSYLIRSYLLGLRWGEPSTIKDP